MENLEKLVPDRRLFIEGRLAPVELTSSISRIVVEMAEELLNQCFILFTDPDQKIINGKDFGPGIAISVELGYIGKLKPVFDGEVVSIEPRFARDKPPAVVVRAYERLHRLALAPKTRSYINADVKAVAQKVAQAHGLGVEAPGGSKDHILQPNITDLELLRKIASRTGNKLYIDRKKLVIGPPPRMGELELVPGEGLKRVKVRLKSTEQVPKVIVRGWDQKAKKEVVGQATPSGEAAAGDKAAKPFARKDFVVEGVQLADTKDAELVAKATVAKVAERYVEATGEILGMPTVMPGAVLSLDKLGDLLDGKYRVTEARHEFDKRGYRIFFTSTRVATKKSAVKFKAPPAAKAEAAKKVKDAKETVDAAKPNLDAARNSTKNATSAASNAKSALDSLKKVKDEIVRDVKAAKSAYQSVKGLYDSVKAAVEDAKRFAAKAKEDASKAKPDLKSAYDTAKKAADAAVKHAENIEKSFGEAYRAIGAAVEEFSGR